MAVILATIALPALGAALTAILPLRLRPAVTVAALAATLVAAVLVARDVLATGRDELHLGVGDTTVSVLVADGLSAGLLLLGAGVALVTAIFAVLQRDVPGAVRPGSWPLSLALLTGLHGLFLAGDLFTAYLMLELVAVAGAALVAWGGGRRLLAAGARYFYAELVASVLFLAGAALVWSAAGTVVIGELTVAVGDSATGMLGLALLTLGLLLKVPVVPLHFWLPAAHTLAPSTVSPLLSGLVVKSAFVVLLRIWVTGVPELATTAFAQVLGALGAVAVVWGGLTALRAEKVKQVVAYSTIAQLGLLLIALPMALDGSRDAWVGGIFHAVAHAVPKAALLMAVALLAQTMGGDSVERLTGAAVHRPLAAFVIGIAGISLIGLPPTGGFVAKWYLVVASISTGQWWWAATIVVGSLLTAAYLARLVQRVFATAPADAPAPADATAPADAGVMVERPVERRVERRATDVAALALAASALLLGLYPNLLLNLLEVGAPMGVTVDG